MKKRRLGLLALLMAASMPLSASSEETMRQELLAELARGASNIVEIGDSSMNRYQTGMDVTRYTAAPERFDLR